MAASRPTAADSGPDTTALSPVLEPDGAALLAELTAAGADAALADPLATGSRLRAAGHPAERVAAALTQLGLRRQARAKLGGHAERMLFTRDGLEQATRLVVAEHHAARLAAAGLTQVADLGCGLGVDSLAFARAGLQVTAIDRDPTVAAAAAHNLAPFPAAVVHTGDALAWAADHAAAPDPQRALWLDPARRSIGAGTSSRVVDPEAFSPPLSAVTALAEAGHSLGVKLGPGLPHEHVPAGAEAVWASVDGDVTEVCLWFGSLARPDVRRAAVVMDTRTGAVHELTTSSAFGSSPELEEMGEPGLDALPGAVLYEPDGAVIRAGLVTDLGAGWARDGGPRTRLLDRHLAYLIADSPVDTALAAGYRVDAVHPLNVKHLKRWAREKRVTRLDVKKRGVSLTPEQLRAQLLGSGAKGKGGGRHATLVLARVGESKVALEVTPL